MTQKSKQSRAAAGDREFSKRLTASIRNLMFVHVGVTVVGDFVLLLLGKVPDSLNSALIAMMPVYLGLQGGYFLKAGVENTKKISAAMCESTVAGTQNDCGQA